MCHICYFLNILSRWIIYSSENFGFNRDDEVAILPISMFPFKNKRMPENKLQRKRGKQSAESAAITRETIIEAAIECFSRLGYGATTVREIAQTAHLTHGTLRHHFGGKLEIWKAVADTVLEYYRDKLTPIILQAQQRKADQEPDPLSDFQQVVRVFIEASYSNPMFAKLLMAESQTDNERAAYVRANFLSLHEPIGILFEQAQAHCDSLKAYTNDSFFLALLSLTFFPLTQPGIQSLLEGAVSAQPTEHAQRIMGILFNHVQTSS